MRSDRHASPRAGHGEGVPEVERSFCSICLGRRGATVLMEKTPCSIRGLCDHSSVRVGGTLHTGCEVCPRKKGNYRRKYEYFSQLIGFPRIPGYLHYYIGVACPHYVTTQRGCGCAQDAVAGVRACTCEAGILKGPNTSSHTCPCVFPVDRGTPIRSTSDHC